MEEKQNHTIQDDNLSYSKEKLEIGVGLNQVDNLKPSKYFYKVIEESKTYDEAEKKLQEYYKTKDLNDSSTKKEKECDIISVRIAKILESKSFVHSPIMLKDIHKSLFQDIFVGHLAKYVGIFRNYNISKEEPILNGDSVNYGNHSEILEYLAYDFEQEKNKDYTKIPKDKWAQNFSKFISNVWQIHPFAEGNTRTIATFTMKYLQKNNIYSDNSIFKENSLYFRNALVLANYGNYPKGIAPDSSYLESFFEKLIIDRNKTLKKIPENIFINKNLQANSQNTAIQVKTIKPKSKGKGR